MSDCYQELCPNWSGDGRVCPCVAMGIEPEDGPGAAMVAELEPKSWENEDYE